MDTTVKVTILTINTSIAILTILTTIKGLAFRQRGKASSVSLLLPAEGDFKCHRTWSLSSPVRKRLIFRRA